MRVVVPWSSPAGVVAVPIAWGFQEAAGQGTGGSQPGSRSQGGLDQVIF